MVDRGPASGFISGDRLALEQIASVEVIRYPGWPSPRFLVDLWRQTRGVDVVYAFFASDQALWVGIAARLRRTRFVVSVGGYDVARVQDHHYGLPTRWYKAWVPWIVLHLSHRVLSMSEAALDEALAAGASPSKTEVLRLGVDDSWVESLPDVPRDLSQAVTVAYVDEVSWSRKGIDRFVEAAIQDHQRRYVLVGRISDKIASTVLKDPPPNLDVLGFVPDDELHLLLRASGIYVQLSWHEGFGVSVVEAMLAGCRPVISESPALREISGPEAVVSSGPEDDVAAVARATDENIDRHSLAQWARRITSMDTRVEGLRKALFPDEVETRW